jgi:rhamnogalacturonan endolyase
MTRWALAALLCAISPHFCSFARAATPPPVAVHQNLATFVLDNGLIRAEIDKASGALISLSVADEEMLATAAKQPSGVWSTPLPPNSTVAGTILVDPTANQGRWAEISIHAKASLDVDIRYTLAAGDHALYCCQILRHPANLPAANVARGGFQLRLNPDLFNTIVFGDKKFRPLPSQADWNDSAPLFSPQARRIRNGPLAGMLIYGWDNAAMQMSTPVYGFTGGQNPTGVWIINPSPTYLTRGGNAIEPTAWLDEKDGAPTLLNWWADEPSTDLKLSRGDSWSHVIGPFAIYCNTGSWTDAKSRAAHEARQWPYAWTGPDVLAPPDKCGSVSAKISIVEGPSANSLYPLEPVQAAVQKHSPGATPTKKLPIRPATSPAETFVPHNIVVGLSADADWQSDLMHPQYWIHVPDTGLLTMPNIPPGIYVLHLYCDGQLGEGTLERINVAAGRNTDLGPLTWRPPHYGLYVWQLGNPDRSAAEYRHGDDPTRWLLWAGFRNEFPDGVNYYIDKSDLGKDWNCVQYAGTTFSIHFPLGFVPAVGDGYLRIALAGASSKAKLAVFLNGDEINRWPADQQKPGINRPEGNIPIDDIARDQVAGYCCEKIGDFSADPLRLGDNVLQLRVTGPTPTDGVIYDCLRLEIRPRTSQMPGQGNVVLGIPSVGWPKDGTYFGSSYKGDPSGDYRSLNGPRRY